MLIIALVGAFVLYVALYFFYEAAGPAISTPPPFLLALRDMVFKTPDSTPLALLKWGVILFAFYILADGLLSSFKRRRRGK
jgi:hypothetical protein